MLSICSAYDYVWYISHNLTAYVVLRGLFKKYADWGHKKWTLFGSYMCGSPSKYSPPKRTLIRIISPHLETVLVCFFYDGFQSIDRICLNLRNRFKSSSFEGFLKVWEQEKITRRKTGKNSDRVFGQKLTSSECWVSELERCRDGKTSCHCFTVLAFCVGRRPSDVSVLQCSKSG